MKIITVLGTRPEFIRLSVIIKKIDEYFGKNHILVDTGQNFDYKLNALFQDELGIRKPDYSLGVKSDHQFERIAMMMQKLGDVFQKENPDYLLILGDTYSAFVGCFVARQFRNKHPEGVKVFHLEAGNRSFDRRVPEEVNRVMIDHASDYNFCYTERSKEKLVNEGIKNNVFVIGNPMQEVMDFFSKKIKKSKILTNLKLKKKDYILATFHRNENVTSKESLTQITLALNELGKKYKKKVVFATHPKTKDMLKKFNVKADKNIMFSEPFGFLDFHTLMDNAFLVLSDSGTVPEECCIKRIPNLILRKATERVEVLEHAGSILVGTDSTESIIKGADLMLKSKLKWQIPSEYLVSDTSDRVMSLILSKINK